MYLMISCGISGSLRHESNSKSKNRNRLVTSTCLTPPGASAGRKSPKTFLTVDPHGSSLRETASKDAYPPTSVLGLRYGGWLIYITEAFGRRNNKLGEENQLPFHP